MKNLLFDLLQNALGKRDALSSVPSEREWYLVFKEAQRQAVAGIALAGADWLMVHELRFMVNMPF